MAASCDELLKIVSDAIENERFKYEPPELFEPISYTLSLGGKRIRPLLTLMSCKMFGGSIEDALSPAIGLEVFHNFTLIHDDILDKAHIRRGQPTVYKKWNTNIAILSGDTMFALSYHYFFKTRPSCIIPVLKTFNQTAIDVCRGQQYDMNFETQKAVSISDYTEMIRLKTAVLLGACVKIGALIGGSSEEDALKAYNFAENLGIAFQLKDDLLDVYSDEGLFGKKTGGDIVSNKKTYLYLKALELLGEKKKKMLEQWFLVTETDEQIKINSVKEIYNSVDIRAYTDEAIQQYYKNAIKHLEAINIDNRGKSLMLDFAENLMGREK